MSHSQLGSKLACNCNLWSCVATMGQFQWMLHLAPMIWNFICYIVDDTPQELCALWCILNSLHHSFVYSSLFMCMIRISGKDINNFFICMYRIVWSWDNVQTFLYAWHVLKAWHLCSMEKNKKQTSAANNPTPHVSITSILWTMEFTSLTRIGLCIFGTCCASICNQLTLSYNFFLTWCMALASFRLWHL